jgi:inner membrane protein
MFIFAHIGITLGAAALAGVVIKRWRNPARQGLTDTQKTAKEIRNTACKSRLTEDSGLNVINGFMDIRILLIGSILPDIVDKPLSFLGFGGGRSIAHTLLIFCVVLLIGFFQSLNFKKTGFLALAAGMFSHLILDFMWRIPQILFWPLMGWSFPTPDPVNWIQLIFMWWKILLANPWVEITEVIGLIIFLGFVGILLRQRKVKVFIAKGKV